MDSTTSNETTPVGLHDYASIIAEVMDRHDVSCPLENHAVMKEVNERCAAFAAGQASREQWRPVPKKLGEFKFMSTETVLTYDPTKPKGERIRQRGTYVGEWSKTVTHYCELPKEPNP